MAKSKLYRYEAIQQMPNVLERKNYLVGDYSDLRGNWHCEIFKNDNPIILELACGKGDYALALAQKYRNYNFIGIDIKGDRMFKGAEEAMELELNNLRFLRVHIDHIENYFGPDEVSGIWITFPDPYLSSSKDRKRLTHPMFLERYRNILTKDAQIHLKTDSKPLMDFTREIIRNEDLKEMEYVPDVYALPVVPPLLQIQTYYEKMHLDDGRTIQYIRYKAFQD